MGDGRGAIFFSGELEWLRRFGLLPSPFSSSLLLSSSVGGDGVVPQSDGGGWEGLGHQDWVSYSRSVNGAQCTRGACRADRGCGLGLSIRWEGMSEFVPSISSGGGQKCESGEVGRDVSTAGPQLDVSRCRDAGEGMERVGCKRGAHLLAVARNGRDTGDQYGTTASDSR